VHTAASFHSWTLITSGKKVKCRSSYFLHHLLVESRVSLGPVGTADELIANIYKK